MAYKLIPLSPSLGAEISGIDLNRLSDTDIDDVRKVWRKYHVVLIRNNEVAEEAYIRFGRLFGEVERARKRSPLTSHPEIMVISNIRKDGVEQGSLPDGELFWHFDRVHQPIPNRAGILQAIQLPASGGETRFVNMCKVYESLPGPIKERLKGLTALNTYDYGQTRAEDKKLSDKTPSAVHPVIRKIPETGEAALYVSRLMTDRIMELPMEESDELLEYLFDRTEKSEHRYEHTWQVNDILIWDNRCVVHARNDFDGTEPRLLKRLTVSDDQPPIPC